MNRFARVLFGLGIVCLGCASARAQGVFAIRPIGATTGHALTPNGDEITIFDVPSRVTLELRVGDWDPDGDGMPLVHLYEAQIDGASYTTGTAGALSLADLPCDDNDDCFATSNCLASGFCDLEGAIYADFTHPEYIFSGFSSFTLQDISTPHYRVAGLVLVSGFGVPDPGVDQYIGTLILDVPADAAGTFTIALRMFDEALNLRTFMGEPDLGYITPAALLPALIHILQDCNQNGVPDDQDIASGTSPDCNANGRPDECEADCNGNGVADECDIGNGSTDCNTNGIPDECEEDCNHNGIADSCETGGVDTDCNQNDVPDVCETGWDQDCNGNGEPDLCDLYLGVDTDCNANAVPDDCDITSGTSGDCNGNNEPDECERDCNRNGSADACDILAGVSLDANGDDVPDECYRGMALIPVGATMGHRIKLNEISILMGGGRVTLEVRIAGWDSDLNDSPKLGLYSAEIDSSGFGGGLSIAGLPCTTSDDCYLSAGCNVNGFCTASAAAYIDPWNPNFVFANLQPLAKVGFIDPDVDYAAFLAGMGSGRSDPGFAVYAGTLILDVPPGTTGTFTIGFTADTYAANENDQALVDLVDRVPGVIRVIEDCNQNGVRDDIDIANGTSTDNDANGAPDECELGLPNLDPTGSRYVKVTPRPGGGPVALRVTSPQFPCLVRYVTPMGAGKGRLGDTPQFLTPEQWGTTSIVDADVVPGTTYRFEAEFPTNELSFASSGSTWGWADVGPPWGTIDFLDITGSVDRFRNIPGAPPLERTDVYPDVPDENVDFLDISATVSAFRGAGYPFGLPCP